MRKGAGEGKRDKKRSGEDRSWEKEGRRWEEKGREWRRREGGRMEKRGRENLGRTGGGRNRPPVPPKQSLPKVLLGFSHDQPLPQTPGLLHVDRTSFSDLQQQRHCYFLEEVTKSLLRCFKRMVKMLNSIVRLRSTVERQYNVALIVTSLSVQ